MIDRCNVTRGSSLQAGCILHGCLSARIPGYPSTYQFALLHYLSWYQTVTDFVLVAVIVKMANTDPLLTPTFQEISLTVICFSFFSTTVILSWYRSPVWSFFIIKCLPSIFNPLNPELNPICYLLALLGDHHFLHVSRIRVKLLNLRRLMSYIYGAPILDVSRSHTTTHHSR